ncbi:unnamed protein product [Owenia fusiformis]|uniref:Uncharacterized protein n=1 Tax=Owenia fusiformis TaxID=6347 RepID=A0A8J1UW15_OWEFU|nr:unnamed protein product [Owenia fusiformis]
MSSVCIIADKNLSRLTMAGTELRKLALWVTILTLVQLGATQPAPRKNVLFLVSDDMRPEINSFLGPDFPTPIHPTMFTPNLDELAGRSLMLARSYVQQAVCSPSRTSLLTGRRPDTTHVYDLVKYFRHVGGNFTTIPQYFKQHGYMSVGMGKIFHPGHASGGDDPPSWSVPYYHAPSAKYWGPIGRRHSWLAVDESTERQHPLPDSETAQNAIETLRKVAPKAKSGEQPFFVAVGFHKPHLPFIFPEKFIQHYPESVIRLPDNQYAPVDMPPEAWSEYGELRHYSDIAKLNASGHINTTLPKDVVLQLRRAYYSALSYTDSLIGDVIGELKNLGLENNTIISFWGDHGWQLGEHGEWCKHTNFELATHAPMLVYVPGITDKGIKPEKLTEFVDLFPTLVEAAGLPLIPLCPKDSSKIEVCTEGQSMIPLARDPSAPWKQRVFSQYPRSYPVKEVMGYTMRTEKYRYTEWAKFNYKTYMPDWTSLAGVELYDHVTDDEENHNKANDPSYKKIRNTLSQQLHQGWRAALPNVRDNTLYFTPV